MCLSRTRNLSKRCLPGNWTVFYFFRLARGAGAMLNDAQAHTQYTSHAHTIISWISRLSLFCFFFLCPLLDFLVCFWRWWRYSLSWGGQKPSEWRGSLTWIANWRTEEMIEIAKHFCIPHFFFFSFELCFNWKIPTSLLSAQRGSLPAQYFSFTNIRLLCFFSLLCVDRALQRSERWRNSSRVSRISDG